MRKDVGQDHDDDIFVAMAWPRKMADDGTHSGEELQGTQKWVEVHLASSTNQWSKVAGEQK